MTIDEAKSLLSINKEKLHIECEKHPSIFFQVCEEYLKTIDKRDFLKEKKDRIYAELFTQMKNGGESKVSDSLADSKVVASQEYTEALFEYLEAKKEADIWSALKDAFIQRGHALKMLVDLFISQYYGTSFEVTTRTIDEKNKIKERLKEGRGVR